MTPMIRSKYPPNWKEIRARILERAKQCCEQCGVPNYSWVDKSTREQCLQDEENVTRIILTISHTDHNTTNNDHGNLRALCQRCHLKHDHVLHMTNAKETRRRKMGTASMFP